MLAVRKKKLQHLHLLLQLKQLQHLQQQLQHPLQQLKQQLLQLLLQQQQQDKMELQRQRAEDSRALREMSMAQGGRRGSGGGDGTNVFEVLMDAVRVCSLGQITNALFEVGGQYRRSM